MENNISSNDYKKWLVELKNQFRHTQLKATIKVNTALLEFYWLLGCEIVEKQKSSTWGDGFLLQLSHDLMIEFPDIKGFSLNNLQYIRRWSHFYTMASKSGTACSTIVQQPVAQLLQIPWGHNLKIISKCSSVEEALFYVNSTIKHGWSRAVLTHQIESGLWQREGKAISNFANTLPAIQSDLAQQTLKVPYCFDFLTLTEVNHRHSCGVCSRHSGSVLAGISQSSNRSPIKEFGDDGIGLLFQRLTSSFERTSRRSY